ncbi:MAG: 3'-5' exonuclease domain-containing protein 2 [Deltaproteobacteria bacterium]|jgi:ribonuclease D|nr:3'-5' exonuclease domain-containing protein 2 [Deltaproteobacteria bacterium]
MSKLILSHRGRPASPDNIFHDFKPAMSKEEIMLCPLFRYEGKTVLVRTEEDLRAALRELAGERVLGFDTESRPSFKKGTVHAPTLLQLASAEAVYLFQLRRVPFDGHLALLLSDPKIVKAGVAVGRDIISLREMHDFEPAGMVDLGEIAGRHNLAQRGLRGLAACLLGVRISKSQRCSNWSLPDLSPRQIAYAATDAWISRRIYIRALSLGLA